MSKLTLSIYLSLLIGGFDGMLSSHQIDGENNFPSTPSIVHHEQVWLDTIANDTSELESNQMYFENYEVLSKYECIGSLDNFSQNLNSGFLVLNKGLELFQTNFKTSGSCWTYVNKILQLYCLEIGCFMSIILLGMLNIVPFLCVGRTKKNY